ncbi:hypothetical protein [Sinorhizobium sp. BG8]|uniref:hypothetical protein n=1 Tax=Sinorhizobium sp. BG8 TaxID=2613773 RepID=UPI00193E1386|nr:hypothetical protein [Sinorhizobium sp. BG8]QRM55265.1 hypothetical protein F3Y30_12505 [Sinorhizobium sp. BG8]
MSRSIEGGILFGHLFVMSMTGSTAPELDSKSFVGPHRNKPVFHFNADDPDGNLLMVANAPQAPRYSACEV